MNVRLAMDASSIGKSRNTEWMKCCQTRRWAACEQRIWRLLFSNTKKFSDLMPLAWSWYVQPAVCTILNGIMEVTGYTHNVHWVEGKAGIDWGPPCVKHISKLLSLPANCLGLPSNSYLLKVPFLRTHSCTIHALYHLLQNLYSMCVCQRWEQGKETAPGVVMPPEMCVNVCNGVNK